MKLAEDFPKFDKPFVVMTFTRFYQKDGIYMDLSKVIFVDLPTGICRYSLRIHVTDVMHDTDDVYSIQSTSLCNQLA